VKNHANSKYWLSKFTFEISVMVVSQKSILNHLCHGKYWLFKFTIETSVHFKGKYLLSEFTIKISVMVMR